MLIGKIQAKLYLSPREAIALIGPASFGPAWVPDAAIDTDMMKNALHNLYMALQSGRVAALYSSFDGHQRRLSREAASDEFFKIDLAHNCCLFGPIVGNPNELKISNADLAGFLEEATAARKTEFLTDEQSCASWLVERLSTAGCRPLNKQLWPEAQERWPNLSYRAYARARGNALAAMGWSSRALSGRPRNEK